MKLITAIIRKEKLNDVLSSLFDSEIHGITVTHVKGHGGETERVETYRGTTVKVELSDKIRLDIVVTDPFEEKAVQTLIRSARTGEVGDGKVFVIPIEKAYRIRTGERDADAVTPVLAPA
jgi:nitrogen regulatory protein P-II 1